MAVKIRLKRMGAKKSPFYRIVAADSRMPRDGRFIEQLGTYDPRQNPAVVSVNKEAVMKWLNEGAQVSDTVKSILSEQGIIAEFTKQKDAAKAAKPKTKKDLKPSKNKPAPKKKAAPKKAAPKADAEKTEETDGE